MEPSWQAHINRVYVHWGCQYFSLIRREKKKLHVRALYMISIDTGYRKASVQDVESGRWHREGRKTKKNICVGCDNRAVCQMAVEQGPLYNVAM